MNREQILSAQTIRNEVVDVPEWGGKVVIRGMSAPEHVEFFSRVESIKDQPARVGVLLLIASLYDEKGEARLLTDADAPELEKQSGAMIDRLCAVANRVNGIGKVEDSGKK